MPPPRRAAPKQHQPPTPSASAWPSSCAFIETLVWDKRVPKEALERYAPSTRDRGALKHPRAKRVKPKIVDEEGHPAKGEYGLFAATKISAKERLIDYHGVVTLSEHASQTSDYTLAFGERNELAIDAERQGNEARMCNDFRGTSRRANAKFDTYVDERGDTKLAIFATEAINKGTEVLISYGKGFWKNRVGTDLAAFTGWD